jgi:hypothetical protein
MKTDLENFCDYIRAKRDKFRTEQNISMQAEKTIEYKAKADVLDSILQEAAVIKNIKNNLT